MDPKDMIAKAVQGKELSTLGNSVVLMFEKMAAQILAKTDLTPEQRSSVEVEMTSFVSSFERIIDAAADETQREAALQAIVSIVLMSDVHGGGPGGFKRLKKRIDHAKGKTAYTAREALVIREIIERLARALWEKRPWFKGNAEGTANEIYGLAYKEIKKLTGVPKQWVVSDLTDPAEKKRAIERIAGRVRNLLRSED